MGHNRDLNPAQLADVEDSWSIASQSPGSIFSRQNVLLKKISLRLPRTKFFSRSIATRRRRRRLKKEIESLLVCDEAEAETLWWGNEREREREREREKEREKKKLKPKTEQGFLSCFALIYVTQLFSIILDIEIKFANTWLKLRAIARIELLETP